MTEKNYRLGIDIGNRLIKVMGDEDETPGTGRLRSNERLYKELVLFAIANYVEGLYNHNLTDKVVLSIAMGMPDEEYYSEAATNFSSINWLIGEHVVFINNLPIAFEIKRVEVIPQEFGFLVLYEKLQGGVNPEIRTMVIDYGGVTRLRTVYDGFQQREVYQDTSGINPPIQVLVNKLKNEGIKNNRRNNRIDIQEILMSKDFKLKMGVSKERDFSKLFQQEIKTYMKKPFEDDLYSGQNFNNIDLIILTGGGANLLEESLYSSLVSELWVPESPETANVRGFYEYLKHHSEVESITTEVEKIKFNIVDEVKISDKAETEVNGYDLNPHRNWIGEMVDITKIDDGENSYTIAYDSGEKIYMSMRRNLFYSVRIKVLYFISKVNPNLKKSTDCYIVYSL